jgi:hypothetical protein
MIRPFGHLAATSARSSGIVALCVLACAGCSAHPRVDPLGAEIDRWSVTVTTDSSSDENAKAIRRVSAPALTAAREALSHGRRLRALLQLAAVRPYLVAREYVVAHLVAADSMDALVAEWNRMGATLRGDTETERTAAALAIRSSAIGAMAEAAVPQVRVYYDASLDYARSTGPSEGLFYIGEAVAQQDFIEFCRSLDERSEGRAPVFRSIEGEIDTLQGELLHAYRPPASIDRHSEFIQASAALKEARELDGLGLRRGALLRYLQASLRTAALIPQPPRFDSSATVRHLDAYEEKLDQGGKDHSIGRLFLETARADIEDTTRGATHGIAAVVAEIVLPRYLAALKPAAPQPARPTPDVTVTLVRWPYT